MVEKGQEQELETAGHITPTYWKWRDMNVGALLTSSFLYSVWDPRQLDGGSSLSS